MTGSNISVIGSFQADSFSKNMNRKDIISNMDFKSILNQTAGEENSVSGKNESEFSVEFVQLQKENLSEEEILVDSAPVQENMSMEDDVRTQEIVIVFSELSDKIKELIINTLEITEEELETAMETLGINYIDIIKPVNLAELCVQLSQAEDISVLLTDESMCIEYKSLLESVCDLTEEVMTESGLNAEDMVLEAEILKQMEVVKGLAEEPGVLIQPEEVPEETELENQAAPAKEDLHYLAEKNNFQEAESVEAEKQDDLITLEKLPVEQDSQEKETFIKMDREKETFNENKKDVPQGNTDEISANFMNKLESSLFGLPETENIPGDERNLIRQITDQIRIFVKPDTTSMEMQLNPENLGKLTLHISSKEGIITAQLITQNQIVKEAIESQLVQLRENLELQGVKVEAIEVTVESHQFERNLSQGGSDSKESEGQAKRRLNMAGSEEADNIDSQSIIENLMAENGNQVDYTA